MKPEPLKGKLSITDMLADNTFEGYKVFIFNDVKSAVLGLIKFHEDRIEELIKEFQKEFTYGTIGYDVLCNNPVLSKIRLEYESIMAIELWLEDVI